MDAKFLNTYNEVILDNFNAVLKQNFLFQTQIKVLEEQVKEKSELETKLASLSSENNDIVELRDEIDGLKDELNNKNLAIQNLNNTDSERHRLQTAVNNQMKEIEGLKSQVGSLQNGKDSEVQSVKIQKDSEIKLLKVKEKEPYIILPKQRYGLSTYEPHSVMNGDFSLFVDFQLDKYLEYHVQLILIIRLVAFCISFIF